MVKKNIKNIPLKDILRYAVNSEKRRLQKQARDYFFAYDVKNVHLQTRTIPHIFNLIVDKFQLNKHKAGLFKKGIAKNLENEFIHLYGRKNVKRAQHNNEPSFKIQFENADYNNVAKKRKKENIIHQIKEKSKISIQLDKDLHEAMRDYCNTHSVTLSSIVRGHFQQLLEESYNNI